MNTAATQTVKHVLNGALLPKAAIVKGINRQNKTNI